MDLKSLTDSELEALHYRYVNELHDLVIAQNWEVYDKREPEFLSIKEELKKRGINR